MLLLLEGIWLLGGIIRFTFLFIALFGEFWGNRLLPIKFWPDPEVLLFPEIIGGAKLFGVNEEDFFSVTVEVISLFIEEDFLEEE